MITDKMSVKKSLENFCVLMNKKAKELNMHNTIFNDPAGVDNYSTAKDMQNCIIKTFKNKTLYDIFSQKEDVIKIKGANKREMSFESKTVSNKDLCDFYKVICGKGGTLFTPKIFNVSVIAEDCDQTKYACTIMGAFDSNDGVNNRFTAAKQAIDIATGKSELQDVCAKSAIVCKLTANNNDDAAVLYKKNPCEVIKAASMSKMITALVALDFIDDINSEIYIEKEMINSVPERFYVNDFIEGDIVSVRDLLSAMFLPSSNAAAFVIGCVVGSKLL